MGRKGSSASNSNGGIIPAIIVAVVPIAINVIDKLVNRAVDEINFDNSNKVLIPSLYNNGFSLNAEQVKELLEGLGLKVFLTKTHVGEADPRYRYCEENQVIDSEPKHKQYVDKGSPVTIKYITSEVVVESRRLFDEKERARVEAEERKKIKREAKKDKVHLIADRAKSRFKKLINKD